MDHDVIVATEPDLLIVLDTVRHRLRGDLRYPDMVFYWLDHGVLGFTSDVQASMIRTARTTFIAIAHTFAQLDEWLVVNARNTCLPRAPHDPAGLMDDRSFVQHDPRTVVNDVHDHLRQHLAVIQPLLQRLDDGEWGFTTSDQTDMIRTIRNTMANVQCLWDELHGWVEAHP